MAARVISSDIVFYFIKLVCVQWEVESDRLLGKLGHRSVKSLSLLPIKVHFNFALPIVLFMPKFNLLLCLLDVANDEGPLISA